MALVKCAECGHEISSSVSKCPHCGKVRTPDNAKAVLWLLVVLFCAWVFWPSGESSVGVPSAPTNNVPAQAIPVSWQYSSSIDSMTGKPIREAYIVSTNSQQFDFPYQGGSRGTLTLRVHPRYGKDVIFNVSKGQLLCQSYDGCEVTLRFDDGKPMRVRANVPEDHGTTTLFLSGYKGLVDRLRKSSKVTVEATFYQAGNWPYTFKTDGLKWQ